MFRVFIAGEEVICNKDMTITEEILSPSSVILNNVYPKSWETEQDYVSNFYYPKDYSICKITRDDKLLFAGIVKNTGEISLNPRQAHFCNVQAISFDTFLSNCDTLDFVIDNKTIEEALEDVIDIIKDYGFIKGEINIPNKNEVIGTYSCAEKTPYDFFQYISDITNTRWNARTVDEKTVAIDFFEPSLMVLKDSVIYSKEYFEQNNIVDISFSYGTYDYRNKQIIKSEEVISNLVTYEYISVKSSDTSSIFLSNRIGEIIFVSSVHGLGHSTVATENERQNGVEADFYYTPGENELKYNDNYGDIPAGANIMIRYRAMVNARQIVYNNDEIDRIAGQLDRKGVISRYETRNDSSDSKELNQIAESYIRYKGTPEISLKITTQNKDLFNVGNSVYFQTNNIIPDELEKEYLVKKKDTKMLVINDVQNVFYEYELSSNFNAESEINYFDNQRAKANGNIGIGEFITRNVDIENTATIIFRDLTVQEVSITTDNILEAPLNAPFVK